MEQWAADKKQLLKQLCMFETIKNKSKCKNTHVNSPLKIKEQFNTFIYHGQIK